MKILLVASLASVAALCCVEAKKTNTKAASSYTNYGCQCDSLTFRDKYGRIQGNCKSTDNTGAQWCYLPRSGHSCTDVSYSSRSNRFPGRVWSYEACATPPVYGGGSGGIGGCIDRHGGGCGGNFGNGGYGNGGSGGFGSGGYGNGGNGGYGSGGYGSGGYGNGGSGGYGNGGSGGYGNGGSGGYGNGGSGGYGNNGGYNGPSIGTILGGGNGGGYGGSNGGGYGGNNGGGYGGNNGYGSGISGRKKSKSSVKFSG